MAIISANVQYNRGEHELLDYSSYQENYDKATAWVEDDNKNAAVGQYIYIDEVDVSDGKKGPYIVVEGDEILADGTHKRILDKLATIKDFESFKPDLSNYYNKNEVDTKFSAETTAREEADEDLLAKINENTSTITSLTEVVNEIEIPTKLSDLTDDLLYNKVKVTTGKTDDESSDFIIKDFNTFEVIPNSILNSVDDGSYYSSLISLRINENGVYVKGGNENTYGGTYVVIEKDNVKLTNNSHTVDVDGTEYNYTKVINLNNNDDEENKNEILIENSETGEGGQSSSISVESGSVSIKHHHYTDGDTSLVVATNRVYINEASNEVLSRENVDKSLNEYSINPICNSAVTSAINTLNTRVNGIINSDLGDALMDFTKKDELKKINNVSLLKTGTTDNDNIEVVDSLQATLDNATGHTATTQNCVNLSGNTINVNLASIDSTASTEGICYKSDVKAIIDDLRQKNAELENLIISLTEQLQNFIECDAVTVNNISNYAVTKLTGDGDIDVSGTTGEVKLRLTGVSNEAYKVEE